MSPMTIDQPALRQELLDMAAEDQRARAGLAAEGSLYDGYPARLELVHRRNATRLTAIIENYGWPGRSMVGSDGAHAAWLLAQHAICNPVLQRRALLLLRTAAAQGEASLLDVAMLEDRVRVCEGRSQRYGTLFDWDAGGEMSPLPIEDADHVDERRRAVGLGSLADDVRRRREHVCRTGEKPPADWSARQEEIAQWYRSRGWRP
jgi:hypothetical protein